METFKLKQGILIPKSGARVTEFTMDPHTLQVDIAVERVLNRMRSSKDENTRLDAMSPTVEQLAFFREVCFFEELPSPTMHDMQSISTGDLYILNDVYNKVNVALAEELDELAQEIQAKKSDAGKS